MRVSACYVNLRVGERQNVPTSDTSSLRPNESEIKHHKGKPYFELRGFYGLSQLDTCSRSIRDVSAKAMMATNGMNVKVIGGPPVARNTITK